MLNIVIKNIKKHNTPYYLSYPDEEWKVIKEAPNNYISNFGRVYSANCDKLLSTFIINSGYITVSLRNKGRKHNYTVHKLVARYFIPNPNNYSDIDHIDNNKYNNHISNLQWCSHRFNTAKRDNSHVALCDEFGNVISIFYSCYHLSEIINVTPSKLTHRLNGRKSGTIITFIDNINNKIYHIKKL